MASAVIGQPGYQPMYKGKDPLVMQESTSPIQVQGDSILLNLKARESEQDLYYDLRANAVYSRDVMNVLLRTALMFAFLATLTLFWLVNVLSLAFGGNTFMGPYLTTGLGVALFGLMATFFASTSELRKRLPQQVATVDRAVSELDRLHPTGS
jgi:hypothetical protein